MGEECHTTLRKCSRRVVGNAFPVYADALSLGCRLVSDFFLPVVGGVEVHIYSLGIQLQKLGHKVRSFSRRYVHETDADTARRSS